MSTLVLHMGWGVVMVWLGIALAGHRLRSKMPQYVLALVLGLWTCVHGPWGPVHWLGMAFQTPSWATQLLCAILLWQRFSGDATAGGKVSLGGPSRALVALGAVLGWVLLLDTLAVWPVSLYAWGNTPEAVTLVAAVVCLPWVLYGQFARADLRVFVGIAAVLLFVATRMPTGNVWDAVLDPCLWLAFQWSVFRRGISRYKKVS